MNIIKNIIITVIIILSSKLFSSETPEMKSTTMTPLGLLTIEKRTPLGAENNLRHDKEPTPLQTPKNNTPHKDDAQHSPKQPLSTEPIPIPEEKEKCRCDGCCISCDVPCAIQ